MQIYFTRYRLTIGYPVMFGLVSVLLVLAVLGAVIAVLTGVATTFKEVGMLYGIGGWPGRVAANHGLVWATALLYIGPPESDWIAAPLIGIVLLGTLCAPFCRESHGVRHDDEHSGSTR